MILRISSSVLTFNLMGTHRIQSALWPYLWVAAFLCKTASRQVQTKCFMFSYYSWDNEGDENFPMVLLPKNRTSGKPGDNNVPKMSAFNKFLLLSARLFSHPNNMNISFGSTLLKLLMTMK